MRTLVVFIMSAMLKGRPVSIAGVKIQESAPLLVEQPPKKPSAAPAPAIITIIATTVGALVIVAALVRVAALRERRGLRRKEGRGGLGQDAARLGCLLRRRRTRLVCGTPLDDLVEFTPIEPDPAAAGAIVDLDALAIRHDEIDLAVGAQHAWGSRLRRSRRCI